MKVVKSLRRPPCYTFVLLLLTPKKSRKALLLLLPNITDREVNKKNNTDASFEKMGIELDYVDEAFCCSLFHDSP